jgi:hypothetical protein
MSVEKDLQKQADNKAKIQQDENARLYKEAMDRCVPVAKAVLKIIGEDGLQIGDVVIPRDQNGQPLPLAESNRPAEYVDAATRIQQLMLDANLKWSERHFIWMLVKQPMDMLQNIVLTDLDSTYQHALCKCFGVELLNDIDFKVVDSFVRKENDTETVTTDTVPAEPAEETPATTEVLPVAPDQSATDTTEIASTNETASA